jgi:hypothetical protein
MQNVEPLPENPTFKTCSTCENKETTAICKARGTCLHKKIKEFSVSFASFERLVEFADPKRSKAARKGARTRKKNKKKKKAIEKETAREDASKARARGRTQNRRLPDPDTKAMLDKARVNAVRQNAVQESKQAHKNVIKRAKDQHKHGPNVTISKNPNPTTEDISRAALKIKREAGQSLPGKTLKQTRRMARDSRMAEKIESGKVMVEKTKNPRHPRVTGKETLPSKKVQTRRQKRGLKDRPNSPLHDRSHRGGKVPKPIMDDAKPFSSLDKDAQRGLVKAWRNSPKTPHKTTKEAQSAIRKLSLGAIKVALKGRWHG